MTRILLTGGAGFIGSHICISLLENNLNLVIVDSYINSPENLLAKVTSL